MRFKHVRLFQIKYLNNFIGYWIITFTFQLISKQENTKSFTILVFPILEINKIIPKLFFYSTGSNNYGTTCITLIRVSVDNEQLRFSWDH